MDHSKKSTTISVPQEVIENKIVLVRGKKVMLDRDLATLYKVETGQLKRAVRRNIDRFPEDFMFELTKKEFKNWRCQFGTSNDKMGLRYVSMVFTEQGVAMLSSVLRSERAVQVNIAIMRVFVRLKEMIATHKELAHKLTLLEKRMGEKDEEIQTVFQLIRKLMAPPPAPAKPKGRIGFTGSWEKKQ